MPASTASTVARSTAALLVGETLAACIVALMYAGGQYLEGFAEKRARRDMTALLARVPRSALRHRDGALEEVPLEQIVPGDRLLVRQGDVVPVDGSVAEGVAVLGLIWVALGGSRETLIGFLVVAAVLLILQRPTD